MMAVKLQKELTIHRHCPFAYVWSATPESDVSMQRMNKKNKTTRPQQQHNIK